LASADALDIRGEDRLFDDLLSDRALDNSHVFFEGVFVGGGGAAPSSGYR
jgi:hypothetical protein